MSEQLSLVIAMDVYFIAVLDDSTTNGGCMLLGEEQHLVICVNLADERNAPNIVLKMTVELLDVEIDVEVELIIKMVLNEHC